MDTYTDMKTAEQEAEFGGYHIEALEQYTPTKHLTPETGLEILEKLAAETHRTSKAADFRYLHRLIMLMDSTPLPF